MNRYRSMTRREFGAQAAGATAALAAASALAQNEPSPRGVIRGEPTAEKVGMQVLADGGNAIDAIVAAALTAAVVVPHQTGIGGYGGHATIAVAEGDRRQGTGNREQAPRIVSIDFNTMAPAAAKPDMFPLGPDGKVNGAKNMHGWLAAGVPGIPAGLQLALDRYGTKSFRDVVQPAIKLARDGFPFASAATTMSPAAVKQLSSDPGSAVIYLRDGKPLTAKDHYSNPDLARLLETLAKDNSVESFYRGEIAERIAAAFAANGGLVTREDLAAYRAREVEPLKRTWDDWTIFTAPLTAGGSTALQAALLLKAMKWSERDPASIDTVQLQVEALRYAWQDRLQYFGDPDKVNVPLDRLLDAATIRSAAAQIEQAVADNKPLPVRVSTRPDQGTINLAAADARGNLAALTLTHGGSFGAQVTVPGLGLTLGHGMSRFDPHPGHPNAPGPHKRPLHNMCPTIVTNKDGRSFAVGARGGRRIPNAVAEVILQLVARGKSLPEAVAAPRMHTEGTLALTLDRKWPADRIEELKKRGYTFTAPGAIATVSAVGIEKASNHFQAAMG
jgi:gamma-glutamyltranspeptidase/glutathione hydrolase